MPPLTSAGLYRPPAPTGFGIPEVIEVRRSFGGGVDMAVELRTDGCVISWYNK